MDLTRKIQQQFQALNPISFCICLFFFFLLLLKLFKRNKPNFPPSPPRLPIIGNLHQLGALPHQSMAALSNKYGPLMLLKLGQKHALVVSSAKMAREVMKTHDIKFSNRPQITAAHELLYQCQDIGFAQYGEYWRQARKVCALELFSVKRVDSFQYVRDEEVGGLMDKIRKACVGGEAVNLSQLFLQTSNNIVSRCVLGEKFEDENGNSRFGVTVRRAMVLIVAFCVADLFPCLWWIDVIRGFNKELKDCFKTLDTIFSKVVEEHKAKIRDGVGTDESKKDFVDIMLQLEEDNMIDYHFSLDNLRGMLLDMFVGGSDTTATALEWTMTELMRNPAAMKKAQEEVRTIIGKKSKIEVEDIQKMEYIQCVIKESLRLHPPVPLLVPRETAADVEIDGYHIPSKTRVFVNAWKIQRDSEYWHNPNEFIPERFMDNNSANYKGQDHEFIPFGSGRRKCPGMSFGVASFEHALANLLHWFDWKLPSGCELSVEEQSGLTVCKKTPLLLNPMPYF
ncbi:cytochrome P450 71A1-like [Cucurbita pepo subsp. pepo]|uniref:cytochrome P450 71A1-like n=1 Tax=Cucurbita pepo subsp. pepo TaxID=3664 RepID=UPI000C9D2E5C|nr:cytochrome P450 71A1-like [Cucurbita pepo subsp. pepo]